MTNTPSRPVRRFSRRSFLGSSAAVLTAASLPSAAASAVRGLPSPDAPPPAVRRYRTLGRTGVEVSDISFGAGNLSNAGVLETALDRGVNYIDTGEHYERGGSERTIGEVLKSRDRSKVFVTTKLNMSFDKRVSLAEIKDRFQKCLERLRTDRVDCLMLHMCSLAQVKHEPYHEAIRELKAEGRVRFSGLSNHGADLSLYGRLDDPMDSVLLAAAEDGRFDIALLVYNYLKPEVGAKVLAACKAKGMGTTLMKMNPAIYIDEDKNILENIRRRYETQGKPLPDSYATLAAQSEERAAKTRAFLEKHGLSGPEQARAAAIKFCLDNPDVDCVCPTINTYGDLDAFLALSGAPMTAQDAAVLKDCADAGGAYTCRFACGECEASCPRGVPVSSIMRYEYYFRAKGQERSAMADYAALGDRGAAACAECDGPCELACPYGVPVRGRLMTADARLTLP